jgi:hypothetical protein
MARHKGQRIEQIIPATGWTAAFVRIDTGARSEVPLTSWALVARDGAAGEVIGVLASAAGNELCDEDAAGFLGYLPPPGTPGAETARDRAKALAATIMTDQQGIRKKASR